MTLFVRKQSFVGQIAPTDIVTDEKNQPPVVFSTDQIAAQWGENRVFLIAEKGRMVMRVKNKKGKTVFETAIEIDGTKVSCKTSTSSA